MDVRIWIILGIVSMAIAAFGLGFMAGTTSAISQQVNSAIFALRIIREKFGEKIDITIDKN